MSAVLTSDEIEALVSPPTQYTVMNLHELYQQCPRAMTLHDLIQQYPEVLVRHMFPVHTRRPGKLYTAFGVSRGIRDWEFLSGAELSHLPRLRGALAHAKNVGKDLATALEAKINELRKEASLRSIVM